MDLRPYDVALLTRGTGAYAYTYSGPPGLETGRIVAASFRNRTEIGIIVGEPNSDEVPKKLERLIPLECREFPGPGRLLLLLGRLTMASVDEIAGHAVFASIADSYCLRINISSPESLETDLLTQLSKFKGKLGSAKRHRLGSATAWDRLADAALDGHVEILLEISGTVSQSRQNIRLKRSYIPDASSVSLLSLSEPVPRTLPGIYLAGFERTVDFSGWKTADAAADENHYKPADSTLAWEPVKTDDRWELVRAIPEISNLEIMRTQATWDHLRSTGGLAAYIGQRIAEGSRILVMAPQEWMLDRIWPALAPLANRCFRYQSDGGSGAAAVILNGIRQTAGSMVAGTQSVWKVLMYAPFDRIILLDPSHPQYSPERYPALDNRHALLASASRFSVLVDIVETGMSVFDGSSLLSQTALMNPAGPPPDGPPPVGRIDTDPLPLELRQPGRRRLVYFNRMGSGRGLVCAECRTAVNCPSCNSRRIHFSSSQHGFSCPQCDFASHELRCPTCGLGNIAIQQPGLEAVSRRPGDYLVHRERQQRSAHSEHSSVLGMSELLEPLAQFWPQEIVYFHAESEPLVVDDWPQALDMASRLWSLYANPQLEYCYLISSRIRTQLGDSLTSSQLQKQWQSEMKLRRLAGLPPYGCIYRIVITGSTLARAAAGRKQAGAFLRSNPDTMMLRLGRPHREQKGFRTIGLFANAGIEYADLMKLRWRIHQEGSGIFITPIRGPWL